MAFHSSTAPSTVFPPIKAASITIACLRTLFFSSPHSCTKVARRLAWFLRAFGIFVVLTDAILADGLYAKFLFAHFAVLLLPYAREGKKDNKEGDKEEEEQKPTKAAQVEAAQRELLQYMQGMPFRSIWWMTKEGAKMKEHVEDMHRQLANRMAEECRRLAEVGEVLLLEEVTGEGGVCRHAYFYVADVNIFLFLGVAYTIF